MVVVVPCRLAGVVTSMCCLSSSGSSAFRKCSTANSFCSAFLNVRNHWLVTMLLITFSNAVSAVGSSSGSAEVRMWEEQTWIA
ncbi:hypothetical protein MHYP_G00132620 [Metynnis hypsauchen]